MHANAVRVGARRFKLDGPVLNREARYRSEIRCVAGNDRAADRKSGGGDPQITLARSGDELSQPLKLQLCFPGVRQDLKLVQPYPHLLQKFIPKGDSGAVLLTAQRTQNASQDFLNCDNREGNVVRGARPNLRY